MSAVLSTLILLTPFFFEDWRAFGGDDTENYEVLQSKSLGRQLVLTKMNRKI